MRFMNALLAATVLYAVSTSVGSKDFPIVHPNEITAKYGKPDRIQSTEYDKPRPPFVTRMLEYKKEHVRFTFLPTAPIGSPPPYKSWYLIGTQDLRDNPVISPEEAA
jgi:hypothetical protein